MNDLVSIIIPTYKRPNTLKRAIQSVLNQTYNNVEIIVVDDNNPEDEARLNTEALMEEFQNYSNLKYIKHEKNKNGSAARNTGFKHSDGAFIMFLDDDDEFVKNKVEAQLKKIRSLDSSWGLCYTSYKRLKNNKTIATSRETREGNMLLEALKRNFYIHAGSNLMIRRTLFEKVGGFDETFNRNQDIEFLIRSLKIYKIAFVDVVGLIVHKDERGKKVDFLSTTSHYLEQFDSIIQSFPIHKQKEIFNMIHLQIFRYYASRARLIQAIKHARSKKLSIIMLAKYVLHLIHRRLSRTVYGFQYYKD